MKELNHIWSFQGNRDLPVTAVYSAPRIMMLNFSKEDLEAVLYGQETATLIHWNKGKALATPQTRFILLYLSFPTHFLEIRLQTSVCELSHNLKSPRAQTKADIFTVSSNWEQIVFLGSICSYAWTSLGLDYDDWLWKRFLCCHQTE